MSVHGIDFVVAKDAFPHTGQCYMQSEIYQVYEAMNGRGLSGYGCKWNPTAHESINS